MRKLKDLVAPGMTATFLSARRGDLIYRIGTFSFAVPIADMGDGEFLREDKAIFFMRWIRKQLEASCQS
jgi:hypothetical protein